MITPADDPRCAEILELEARSKLDCNCRYEYRPDETRLVKTCSRHNAEMTLQNMGRVWVVALVLRIRDLEAQVAQDRQIIKELRLRDANTQGVVKGMMERAEMEPEQTANLLEHFARNLGAPSHG